MRTKLFLALLFGSLVMAHPAIAKDTQYTIQAIWMDQPSETLPTFSTVADFNDAGYVVGRLSAYPGQAGEPFWWHDGNFLPISPSIYGVGGSAIDINNSNQFVGSLSGPSPYHDLIGFYVDNGVSTLIPFFAPTSIDENGVVYGHQNKIEPPSFSVQNVSWQNGVFSSPATNPESNSHGDLSQLTNLKSRLVEGYDPLWQELTALGVMNNGQIIGNGQYGLQGDGHLILSRGFIMTPVVTPEPSSMLLFGLGSGLLGFAGRRKRISK